MWACLEVGAWLESVCLCNGMGGGGGEDCANRLVVYLPLQGRPSQLATAHQLQHHRRSSREAVPAWVKHAKQAAVDVTPALLAAAAKCPPLAPFGHTSDYAQQPTQGWLAYRVAAQLPQAKECRSAAAVLELGAAAATAAAREVHGAPLVPAAAAACSRECGSAGTPGMDLAEAAGRLLAAAGPQPLAGGQQARSARFFAPRSAARCVLVGREAAAALTPMLPIQKNPCSVLT
jgi:hypothetical protein